MAKLTYLVGLPKSNKTLYAEKLKTEKPGTVIFSPKEIRHVMKDTDCTEKDVFDILGRQTAEALGDGCDVIVDCTNVRSRSRRIFLDTALFGIPCEKECVIMATPLDVCISRNHECGDIPDKVIMSMYSNWETPAYWEGWNSIWAYYEDKSWMGMAGKPTDFVSEYLKWDQQSTTNRVPLGEHCNDVANIVTGLLERPGTWERKANWRKENLIQSALIHDCGKPSALTFDENGNALYYHHANMGGYEALFYEYPEDIDPIYVSALVSYHMAPYDWKTHPRNRMASLRTWGRDFYEDILALHEADMMAR